MEVPGDCALAPPPVEHRARGPVPFAPSDACSPSQSQGVHRTEETMEKSRLPRPPDSEPSATEEVTAILRGGGGTEKDALDRLLPLVYDQLRRVARIHLATEQVGHTLNTTALVHETYLRLVDQTQVEWADRARFFAVASVAMRRILVDHARKHATLKRGGEWSRVPLDPERLSVEDRAQTLIELDQALTRLAEIDERMSRVVECRFFGGMTEEETAEVLGVSARTVRSDWATAKGLLYLELSAP
jgi:RNA polymerase sigma factor (TIGR02999 family)